MKPPKNIDLDVEDYVVILPSLTPLQSGLFPSHSALIAEKTNFQLALSQPHSLTIFIATPVIIANENRRVSSKLIPLLNDPFTQLLILLAEKN